MASSSSSNRHEGKIIKRANPATIQDKFMVGYQGWFTCGGDGEPVGPGHHGWLHWINAPIPDGGHPNVDLWPDVSSYSPSELFPVPGLKTKTGDPVSLFSSRNPKTVQRHFHWMAEHGVDGAFLQRFLGQCDVEGGSEGIMRIRDEVGDRVQEAAEREGRVFAIMYDVVGVPPERVLKLFQRDWMHLIRNKGILDSPNYLKERGKPVVALWGFGFDNAKHTPELVRSVVQFFRNTTPGGVYIMAGTPSSWRTAEGDADPNPEFLNVWLDEFDAISPWTVGRYSNDQEADNFMETKMKGDVELINRRNEQGTGKKIDYIPVVLPGGSGFNTSEGRWGFNNIKRNGGRFLWKQIANAKRLGVRTIYGAMWDEYDEGTAFMPAVEHKSALPDNDKFKFMALDEDGYDVPADWYMRVCGFAAEGLRGERRIFDTFPVKELQDYWSSRPKYEQVSQKSGEFVSGHPGGSGDGDGQTYQEWLASQKDEKDELPPPPYTLISDEPEASGSTPAPARAPSPAPAPIPVGASHPGPASISSAVPTTIAPASTSTSVPGAASLTSSSPQAPQTGLSSFNDGSSHSQAQRVSGYGDENPNNNTGRHPSQSYQPGAAPTGSASGSAPATHPPHQSYHNGGATPSASRPNEVQQTSGPMGYGPSSYNTSPNPASNASAQSQQPYPPSGPVGGPQQGNYQTGYGQSGYQSGPPPNVPGGPLPQQSCHGAANHGPQNSNALGAPGGAASSCQGGAPAGPPSAAHPQQPYPPSDYARQNDSGAHPPVGGPHHGNNQAGYPPHGHQSGPQPHAPGGPTPQQPYHGIANQGPPNNNPSGAPGGSAGSYQGAPPGPPGAPRPQQPYNSADPVSSLATDFGRQSISGSGAPPTGTTGGHAGRPGVSPPPGHPAHSSTNRPSAYGAPSSTYPGNNSRPQSQQGSRPQTTGYSPNPGGPVHNIGPNTPGQWPPKDWNINQQQTTGSQPPPIPHSTHPPVPPVDAGVNPPRPGTVPPSGYSGGVGASVRPSASVSHRPSSRPPSRPPQGPPPSGNYPSSYRPVSPSSGFPSVQSYSAPSQPYGVNENPFPQPHPSSAPYSTSSAPAVSFPGGPSAPYPPSMSSYQAPGGSSFPGPTEGTHYGSSRPSFAWPGGPSGSPPHSPGSSASFPGADVYNPSRPYSPGASNSSFPSSSPYPPGGGLGAANVGGLGFSTMPGAQSYPGSSMPSADQSAYQPSYGPGDQYNPPSTYPGSAGSSFPSASPWASGSGSGSMMPPPRPANYSSTSFGSSSQQAKPSATANFPMASNALGFALNAVDKVAGKKTRDQLENQVENLAQTGTKLFNKLTR